MLCEVYVCSFGRKFHIIYVFYYCFTTFNSLLVPFTAAFIFSEFIFTISFYW